MATTSPTSPASAAPVDAAASEDWPAKATEAIVTQIGKIRDKTTGPVLTAAHWVVYAAFAVSLGTVALVILVVGSFRALDAYLPEDVWAAYTLLGSVLLLGGIILYRVKVIPARRS